MGYVLGIDLGTSRTAAAVMRSGSVDIVPLSDNSASMRSVVFVREGDSMLVGDAARRRGQQDPSRLAREFKRRFGDRVPLVLGSASLTAEDLTSVLLRHVVDFVSAREGSSPDTVVVTHPANWGAYRRELLVAEVAKVGVPGARLVTEPDAAAIHHASGERMAVGDIIAVYDLGGGTFDATVLRRTATGFEQVGEPKGIERLGGVDFDDLVFEYVQQQAGIDASRAEPNEAAAYLRLREDCTAAKEALSDDHEVTVPVTVGGVERAVSLTRERFEALIRPSIRDSVHCLRSAIVDAGLQMEDITAVLLVGGSSRIPLVAQMIRVELGRPIVLTSNPKEAVALGAARIGAGATPAEQVGATPPPSVPSPPTPFPSRAAPTPPPDQRAPFVAPATVQPKRKVGKGAWIAVAALLVAGGIGTAIAVSGGDDGDDATAETIGTAVDTTDAVTTLAPTTSNPVESASTSSTTPTTTGSEQIYVIQSGDRLGGIADALGVDLNELMALNGITNPNIIEVGQVLLVPPTTAVLETLPDGRPPDDITESGTVAASSVFPDQLHPAANALDGDLGTSWFSNGDGDKACTPVRIPTASCSEFSWVHDGNEDVRITELRILNNSEHAIPELQTGFGFGNVTVTVSTRAGQIAFEQNFPLDGEDPDLTITVDATGHSVRLIFEGHDNPTCGGISELQVIGTL